ncbi:hypothetical protein GCM10028806_33920 [Spirosoma terrae]|uniref:Uncharacterized protein n=1 Tax=Spirosoma terrae TaxID=1968276 RepID=A0A6L9L5C4_9BACT|nr:hypothetical protein [Spirosoma terrae]NDU95704.1 hypothetical protein [Spirosoma terrae]
MNTPACLLLRPGQVDKSPDGLYRLIIELLKKVLGLEETRPTVSVTTTLTSARTMVIEGQPAIFILTEDEDFGQSLTFYDGENYYASPLVART